MHVSFMRKVSLPIRVDHSTSVVRESRLPCMVKSTIVCERYGGDFIDVGRLPPVYATFDG